MILMLSFLINREIAVVGLHLMGYICVKGNQKQLVR